MSKWFKNNTKFEIEQQMFNLGLHYRVEKNSDSPCNPFSNAYLSTYDSINNRFILTKKEILLSSEGIENMVIINEPNLKQKDLLSPDKYPDIEPNEPDTPGSLLFNIADNNFFYSFYLPAINMYQVYNITPWYIITGNYFISKGWTISFSNGWTSFHNYIPDMYIKSNKKFYSVRNSHYEIWEHNIKNSYLNFYGQQFSFILDYVAFKNPIDTTMYDNILIQTSAYINDVEQRYITFNKMIVYNDRQSSGELILESADNAPDEDYMMQTVKNIPGTLKIRKENRDWIINGFRDNVVKYDEPLFLPNEDNTIFIDKLVNQNVIDVNKAWEQQERFKDKYLRIRLIFDTRIDTKLISRYTIESEQNTNV
jgi:hypothetical protein